MARDASGADQPAIAALTQASGAVLGIGMPLAMFLANRSAAFILVIAALLALAGVWRSGRIGDIAAAVSHRWTSLAVLSAAFLVLGALSLLWSAFPKSSAFGLGEFVIPVAAALVLGLCWRIRLPDHLGLMLAIGLALGAVATMADLATGMAFRRTFGIRPQHFVLNRTVVAHLVLVWAMLAVIERRLRWLAWLAAVLVVAAIAQSESGAAKMGVLIGATGLCIAMAAPRLATFGLAGGTALLIAVQPWLGTLSAALIPARMNAAMADAHSGDRINIWQSFGAAVEQHPLLGAGFNASARMADNPLVQRVPAPLREMLGAGHPHDSFLQVWVELGAVGAGLAAAILCLACLAILRLPDHVKAYAAALAATIVSIAAVSHGAWQAWWIACVGAAIAMFLSVKDQADERV